MTVTSTPNLYDATNQGYRVRDQHDDNPMQRGHLMAHPKIEKLKSKYETARVGLDKLQEEVLSRGIEMRPGLRRQFDEALRGLFYTMACADGHIDQAEVAFYNYLFEEELSVATFELVRAQLERSKNVFEEDFLATVTAFASYDRSITGKIPLDAPSLSTLLISAADSVGRMVMSADGSVDDDEVAALKSLIVDARHRAELVRAGAESLLEGQQDGPSYDPDAKLNRDIRGTHRMLCAGLTEIILHASDIITSSGISAVTTDPVDTATAAQFVTDSIRDDLERGKASGDLLSLAASQIRPIITALRQVESAGDAVSSSWRAMASEARSSAGAHLESLKRLCAQRILLLREKHDWADEVSHLEQQIDQAWEMF